MAAVAGSPAALSGAAEQSVQELLLVDGMFCAACSATLERRLTTLPGVEDAVVDLAAGAALLRWLPGRVDTRAACELAAALGYSARRPDAPAPADSAADPGRSLQINLAVALFFGMWVMLPSIALYLRAAPNEAVANGLAWTAAIASLPVIAYSGRPFYAMAAVTLRAGAGGIDALVTIGVLGAVALSLLSLSQGGSDVYFEVAVALITLQLLARLIELKVARAGRDATARLLDLAPRRVLRLDERERGESVRLAEVKAGDVLLAETGETLAVDGILEGAEVRLDRHLLTGESRAARAGPGDAVFAGEVVVEGPLRMRVTEAAGARRIDALSRQVRTLLMRKPGWQRGIDAVARHFLLLAALAAAAGAMLAASAGAGGVAIAERALAVFVIACPCALSLAAPLAGLGAARRAAEAGMLLRDLRVVARTRGIDTLFVDKTGTLTEGRPRVRALRPVAGVEERELLETAALLEKQSRHPFAAAIIAAAKAAGIEAAAAGQGQPHTVVGRGVRLEAKGGTLRIGSASWFAQEGLRCPRMAEHGLSRVWVARGERVLGAIDLDDPLRAGARAALDALRRRNIAIIMLSGDGAEPVARLCEQLGIEGIARCSPEQKVAHVQAAAARGAVTAFVGDGLNDGPAIAAADLGIAVDDALDAARTASAASLLRGGVERVPELLALIGSARRVLRQNVGWAVAYNALAVPAALIGWVHPAVAAIAMAASSITVVLNSLRIRGGGDAA